MFGLCPGPEFFLHECDKGHCHYLTDYNKREASRSDLCLVRNNLGIIFPLPIPRIQLTRPVCLPFFVVKRLLRLGWLVCAELFSCQRDERKIDARFDVVGAPYSLLSVSLSASQNLYTRRGTLVGLSGKPDNVCGHIVF